VRDIVAQGNCPRWLTGLALLVGVQLRLTAHLHSPCLGKLPALAGARADQFALELGEAAQDGQHQAAVGRGSIGPSIIQGPETGPLTGDRRHGVEQVAG